ncbi:hypothetical protein C8R46DRAFT_1217097 [Mycena filopes]|nr:hypothetical protein C8R46DRAFT_1217097 [Mycena filopes]
MECCQGRHRLRWSAGGRYCSSSPWEVEPTRGSVTGDRHTPTVDWGNWVPPDPLPFRCAALALARDLSAALASAGAAFPLARSPFAALAILLAQPFRWRRAPPLRWHYAGAAPPLRGQFCLRCASLLLAQHFRWRGASPLRWHCAGARPFRCATVALARGLFAPLGPCWRAFFAARQLRWRAALPLRCCCAGAPPLRSARSVLAHRFFRCAGIALARSPSAALAICWRNLSAGAGHLRCAGIALARSIFAALLLRWRAASSLR